MTVIEPDPGAPPPEGQPPDSNVVTIQTQPEPPAPPQRQPRAGADAQVFSPEDVERIRQEERDRYQTQLSRADELQAELAKYRATEEERAKVEEKARKDAERVEKKKKEEEMEMRDLLAQKEAEFDAKLAEEREARQRDLAIIEKERAYSALQNYLAQKMMEEGQKIAPQLRPLVAGNTQEEIDASIAQLVAISDDIAGENQQLIAGLNSQRRTAGVTAPPMGPTEGTGTTRSYSADDLKDMSMEEYGRKEVREQLLAEAGRAYRNR